MKYSNNIQKTYDITEDDLRHIVSLRDVMAQYKDDFITDVFDNFTKKFRLPGSLSLAVLEHHKEILSVWYDKFFEGKLNNTYISYLQRFGELQKRYNVEYEWVNSVMSFVRQWVQERIFQNLDEDDSYRKEVLISVNKLIDINVDVINFSFYESKMKDVNPIVGFRQLVIGVSEQFAFFMHSLMVGILITMAAAAAIFFGLDILYMLKENADKVIITALGSLLLIWVLVELLNTEIQMLKGGKFRISIFIGVAMIAFIRDLLIITLKHETSNPVTYGFVLASILVLGIIYWVTSKTEK